MLVVILGFVVDYCHCRDQADCTSFFVAQASLAKLVKRCYFSEISWFARFFFSRVCQLLEFSSGVGYSLEEFEERDAAVDVALVDVAFSETWVKDGHYTYIW